MPILSRRALLGGLVATPLWAVAAADRGAVFDAIWRRIARDYWDPELNRVDWAAAAARFRPQALAAPDETGFYRIVNRMLALIGDSHVYAQSPAARSYDEQREDGGETAGFGIATAESADGWRIFAVRPGGPAARAGVEIGWVLLAVGSRPPDTDWHPMPGEAVILALRDDDGRTRSVRVTAEPLATDPPRATRLLAGGILLLRLDAFDDGDARWIGREIEAAAPRAVILDLRENGGGGAIEGARVAGRFFAEKRTLLRRIERRRSLDVPILSAGRRAWTGPLALLVGPRSASAAEALAALVGEAGRGPVVGERTAGALTGAVRIDLPDGGLLSIAEADVRTPGGKRIEGVGVVPTDPITPALADLRAGRDPVLARAQMLLSAG
ncbi:S41 family peptidase [Sphingomonas sp. 1P06PA]|uniref:S41 family peptidase n=1 Tax=Sphingomonas sp. 1P06PA TaxID=554121 RepID=UPI0039A479E7